MFAVLGVVGGVLLAATDLLDAGFLIVLGGPVAVGIYVGGLVRKHPGIRVLSGILAGFISFSVTRNSAKLVSLLADEGAPRDALEDGTFGVLWVLAGLFVALAAVKERWPMPARG
ncbi:hypothetical protein BBK82_40740 [Lentzea guizhouensis]|uniref:Uncharacterized protein n=1 Tax=Lentzea guizhouensis TaxID=1586287 RepID=A0A1B2HUK3_9PSEU|nr:hypothetical protein BBK82_40740 [Lentzea guizhouensis]